jgi:hypothetical protein
VAKLLADHILRPLLLEASQEHERPADVIRIAVTEYDLKPEPWPSVPGTQELQLSLKTTDIVENHECTPPRNS